MFVQTTREYPSALQARTREVAPLLPIGCIMGNRTVEVKKRTERALWKTHGPMREKERTRSLQPATRAGECNSL